MIDSLGTMHSTVLAAVKNQASLEYRVSSLEQWREDQIG